MAETTIEWTRGPNGEPGFTFNGWTGCTKVGPGCDHCYAEAWSKRAGAKVGKWGPGAQRVRTTPANWRQPLKWNDQAAAEGRRFRVFCSSLADVFDNEVPVEWRVDLFRLIESTPHLDWLLLTKRIGNAKAMLPHSWLKPGGWPKNARLGATMVNQEEWDRDIGKLLALDVPNFVSLGPLLGPIDMRLGGASMPDYAPHHPLRRLEWVVVEGESGHKARLMHPAWARSLRDQCAEAGVPFMFKQWGESAPVHITAADFLRPATDHQGELIAAANGTFAQYPSAEAVVVMRRVGKKAAGRLLDGKTHDGSPGSPHA